MQINIKIEFEDSRLPVYNVSRILNSFVLIHNGLALRNSENFDEFARNSGLVSRRRRFEIPFSISGMNFDLEDIGAQVLDGSIDSLAQIRFLSRYESFWYESFLLEAIQFDKPLELVSISKGSLDTVVEEFLEWIRTLFMDIVQTPDNTPSILREAQALPEDVPEIVGNVSAGIVVLGATALNRIYREQNVTGVKTRIAITEESDG